MESTAARIEKNKQQQNPSTADRVMITYYTDPLCCWSWALEPHWRKLKEEYADRIEWQYVMGGMLQDWNSYNDPMNAVTRPLQFGPIWMHASHVSQRPMNTRIWHDDPPASSYPSCIAVACAMLQCCAAGELLLEALREAVMMHAQNIARESVILSIARNVSETHGETFVFRDFQNAWSDGRGMDAFRKHLMQVRFLGIGRFPTLTFTQRGSKGIMVTGYRPFEVLKDALDHIFEQGNIKQNPS